MFFRIAGHVGGLLLGGPFLRRFLMYACLSLAVMFLAVGVPQPVRASGPASALIAALMVFASTALGLLGAIFGVIGKKVLALLFGEADSTSRMAH